MPLLIGMGVRELSMTPFSIALARHIVRGIELKRARALVAEISHLGRADEVRERLTQFFEKSGLFKDSDFGPVLRRLLRPRPVRPT